jgi:hypothetical protein
MRLQATDLAQVESFFAALTATSGDFTDSFVALTAFVADLQAHLQGGAQLCIPMCRSTSH